MGNPHFSSYYGGFKGLIHNLCGLVVLEKPLTHNCKIESELKAKLMRSEFEVAFNEITESRALPRDVVLEALKTALVSAYRRDSNASAAQRVEAVLDPDTGRPRIYVEKEVVEEVENPNTEVALEKARFYHPEAQLGETVMVQVEGSTKNFGRIAAQTAKQVILQKIREAERNSLYDEYVEREGDLITGTVQSVNSHMVTLSLGRAEAIMPRAQQIPGERYRPHEKLRTYVLEVKRSNRGPQIVVSRAHRNMLRRLLEYEVPEIFNGQVEIKSIAREAGYRSKVAVAALQEGIDPVGACVGMRGMRIQNIVKELHEEKIDVIEWNPDHEVFIAKALSPARVSGVFLDEDLDGNRTAVVVVPDDQLSLAIGREGQNARLAAKLTGWRIDIKSVSEVAAEAIENLDSPILADLQTSHADIIEEVGLILQKKAAELTVMPEEYTTLGRFAALVEARYQAARTAEREARLGEINAVKATLPEGVFALPVDARVAEFSEQAMEALQSFENFGEILWRYLLDEEALKKRLGDFPEEEYWRLTALLDRLIIPEELEALVATLSDDVAEAEGENADEAVAVDVAQGEMVAEGEEQAQVMPEATAEIAEETIGEQAELPDAFGDESTPMSAESETDAVIEQPEEEIPQRVGKRRGKSARDILVEEFDDVDEMPTTKKGKKKKKKKKSRQLLFDEDTGELVTRYRRKSNRARDNWDEYYE